MAYSYEIMQSICKHKASASTTNSISNQQPTTNQPTTHGKYCFLPRSTQTYCKHGCSTRVGETSPSRPHASLNHNFVLASYKLEGITAHGKWSITAEGSQSHRQHTDSILRFTNQMPLSFFFFTSNKVNEPLTEHRLGSRAQ